MELDQLIFKKVINYFKKKKQIKLSSLDHVVHLEDLIGRLNIIARSLTGAPIDVVGSEREGGWKNNIFFLPEKLSIFPSIEENISLYLFRVFYLSVQSNLNLNWEYGTGKTQSDSQDNAIKTAPQVLKVLFEEYPLLEEIHLKLLSALPSSGENGNNITPDLTWLYGRWMLNGDGFNKVELLSKISKKTQELSDNTITTEIKAKQADEIEVIQIDKKAKEDYTLTHNFEKVETIDEHSGVWRDFDGDDNLKEESDALEQFNLSKVIRVDDPVHSVYKSDFVGNATIAESVKLEDSSFHYLYPEWDYSKRNYKESYCKVFHKRILKTNAEYYIKTLEHNKSVHLKLKKVFSRIHNERQVQRHLTSGEGIDIDALTDRYADIKAGHTPDERIYFSKRKKRIELSILFLLDLSLSSDGYSKGNRIIDVEKQVSILLGEVFDEYKIDFQIDGFFSKTRNNTTYITLKSFDDSWDKAKFKIGAVQPSGYTRIGPAIRHGTYLLKKRSMRKKWLVLLSDGKPNDYDRYEGKYGIYDIKQALREMVPFGISNFAIAIEEQAKYYLPQMFGKNHYNILSSPVEMIDSLAQLFKRIEKD